MEMKYIIELTKILGPSAIIAGVLTYLFNRRIEKLKVFSKTNEEYLSAMVKGLNKFMVGYKKIVQKADEIEKKFDDGSLSEMDRNDLFTLWDEYRSDFEAHRIYLIPILPFGTSDEGAGVQDMAAISAALELLFEHKTELTEEKKSKIVSLFHKAIQNLRQNYNDMGKRGNSVIKQINNGKLLFKM